MPHQAFHYLQYSKVGEDPVPIFPHMNIHNHNRHCSTLSMTVTPCWVDTSDKLPGTFLLGVLNPIASMHDSTTLSILMSLS